MLKSNKIRVDSYFFRENFYIFSIMQLSQNVSICWEMNYYVKNTYLTLVNIKKI